tara:strand:+ start:894 stop:1523 length:630 start_codon:yes stop_codon:yes gene_type:complete
MRKIFTIILLITNTFYCQSQDKVAKDILEKISSVTKSYDNIKIEFNFLMTNKTHNINEYQEGILELEKNKFRITMDDQIIINDGAIQWIYLKESNELQITENDPEENTMNPHDIFTIYEKGYKYKYIGKKSIDNNNYDVIDLFPKESINFTKITLIINTIKNQLKEIQIQDKNGGTYKYVIKNLMPNTNLSPFKFNQEDFPDIDIIDLR